jgi:TrmH family RNA methyltransferase
VLTRAELQRLRSLREKKNREALGIFVAEGEKVVGELIAAGFPFEQIYATDAWSDANAIPAVAAALPPRKGLIATAVPQLQPAIPVIRITSDEMARASHFPTPSSVLAVGRITHSPLDPASLACGLTLALDGVQDAGNVGTLLRIADWFACDRVVMSPDCADVFHQKVINASMGSFARVKVHTADLALMLGDVSSRFPAVSILGCDLTGDDVHTLPSIRGAIVVVGSEGRGLSAPVAAHITRRVTIPRFGRAESLNAAIAAAIVCDNLRRHQN